MKTRTAVFTAPKSIEIREFELPPLGAHQILVKVKSCALCTWEQRFYKGSASEDYPFRGGHEVAGEVVELGKEANCVAGVGDPVCLAIMTRCGTCDFCRRGMDNFCDCDDGGRMPGQPWGPGGLSDYVILEDYQVYSAGHSRDFASLALAEPVACVARSVSRPEIEFGDAVLVQGAGIMGLLHILLLKQQGVRVMVSEPDAARREQASALGATVAMSPFDAVFGEIVQEFTRGRGFKAIFFTAGGVPAVEQGVSLLSKGGWLCLYGSIHPKGMMQLDPNCVHYNEYVLTGTFSHTRRSFRQAVEMLSYGLVDVSHFISKTVAFPDVQHGFELAVQPDTYRVVMMFE